MTKKNYLVTLLLIACLIQINSIHVFSYTIPSIRIGLEYKYKNVSNITIQNSEILIGYDTGGYFTKCAELFQGPFTASATDDYYVRIPNQFQNYQQATQYSLSYSSYNAIVGLRGPSDFYVYLGGYSTEQEAYNIAGNTGGTVVSLSMRGTVIAVAGRATLLFDNDSLFPQIQPLNSGGFVNLGDRQYRGAIELNRTTKALGKLTAVNVCTIDEYLYSVVPSEMPGTWHAEAIKAQAVASRSYTLTRLHAHQSSGYNLCDSGHCQVYNGASAETEKTLFAIYETSGILAMHNGKPINALYFSSSGGRTDDSENVWTDYIPYLRSVNDSTETGYKIWTRTFTFTEISNLLNARNTNIGNIVGVAIKTSPVSGRVSELQIQGATGNVSYEKEEIRTLFSSTTGGLLESRYFSIVDGVTTPGIIDAGIAADRMVYVLGASYSTETNLASTYVYSGGMALSMQTGQSLSAISSGGITHYSDSKTGSIISGGSNGQVTFSGRGYGHGVGMSQYGANSLAEAGYSFLDILRHYYTGVYFSNDLY